MTRIKLQLVRLRFRWQKADGTRFERAVEGYVYPNGAFQAICELYFAEKFNNAFYRTLEEFIGRQEDIYISMHIPGGEIEVTLAEVARRLKAYKTEYGMNRFERRAFWGGLLGARRIH